MSALETLRERLPDAARDIRLNLQTVLDSQSLSADQRNALGERAADLSPEQYAALRESAEAVSLSPISELPSTSSISNHPVPNRAGLSARSGFRAAGGRGGGRRR